MTIVNMIVKTVTTFLLTIVMQNIEEKVAGMIVAYSENESNSSVSLHYLPGVNREKGCELVHGKV